VHAAEVRPARAVDVERELDFSHDVVEIARLDADDVACVLPCIGSQM